MSTKEQKRVYMSEYRKRNLEKIREYRRDWKRAHSSGRPKGRPKGSKDKSPRIMTASVPQSSPSYKYIALRHRDDHCKRCEILLTHEEPGNENYCGGCLNEMGII